MKRIFYDNRCPFCRKTIRWIEKKDKKHQFITSSLHGSKAKAIFAGNYAFLRAKKSVVLIEGNRVWTRANAVLRILWLLGGPWKILGALHVLPGFLINPFYRLCTFFVWR